MEDIKNLIELLEITRVFLVVQAFVLLFLGYFGGRFVSATIAKLMSKKARLVNNRILQGTIFYIIFGLFCVSALRQLGFDLAVVLSAIGILVLIIGLASLKSLSNLMSGFFLRLDRPFLIGDIIEVNHYTGEVIAIDFLSVKLCTSDNLFIRIPHEIVIKKEIANLTTFPIRRLDLNLSVNCKEDIEAIKILLLEIAEQEPLCFKEPAPQIILNKLGPSSIDIQFSVWLQRENLLVLKNRMMENIKSTFDKENIEISCPHDTLYSRATTEPIAIKLIHEQKDDIPILKENVK